MANIDVLGKFTHSDYIENSKLYRGVDRVGINYPVEYFGTTHEIIEVNDEYEKLTANDLYIHDLAFAKKLRDVYQFAYPEIEREIVEIVFSNRKPELNGTLLGYDIGDSGDSNILRIILQCVKFPSTYDFKQFGKELNSVSISLMPLLNDCHLFNSYEEASKAHDLIESVFIRFNEAKPHHNFKVIAVYLID